MESRKQEDTQTNKRAPKRIPIIKNKTNLNRRQKTKQNKKNRVKEKLLFHCAVASITWLANAVFSQVPG